MEYVYIYVYLIIYQILDKYVRSFGWETSLNGLLEDCEGDGRIT